MIALLVACCVPYPRILWIALTVLAVIAAVGELLVLIGVVGDQNIYCSRHDCGMNNTGILIVSIIALLSWLGVGYSTWQQGEGSGNNRHDLPR